MDSAVQSEPSSEILLISNDVKLKLSDKRMATWQQELSVAVLLMSTEFTLEGSACICVHHGSITVEVVVLKATLVEDLLLVHVDLTLALHFFVFV